MKQSDSRFFQHGAGPGKKGAYVIATLVFISLFSQGLLSNGINSKGLETLQYQKYTLLESCSGELSVMQVRLTAMKSQKVQELAKKENPNIFKEQFQIATPHPHNTQNGVL